MPGKEFLCFSRLSLMNVPASTADPRPLELFFEPSVKFTRSAG